MVRVTFQNYIEKSSKDILLSSQRASTHLESKALSTKHVCCCCLFSPCYIRGSPWFVQELEAELPQFSSLQSENSSLAALLSAKDKEMEAQEGHLSQLR